MDKNYAPQPLYTAHGKPAGRIRQKNEESILAAAAEEFARYGFKGTSMNAIATRAGLPKANVHYYFNSKLGLYVEVMRHILELWAGTQHYADFSDQIRRINGKRMTRADFAHASDNLIAIILKGCGLTPPPPADR